MRVRDLTTGVLGPSIDMGQPTTNWIDLAWSPDGTLLNGTTGDTSVGVWDAATGRRLAEHGLGSEGASIAVFSRDGRHLLVGTTAGRLHVLDARSLKQARDPIQVTAASPQGQPAPVGGLEPSPDGRTVIALSAQEARLVDTETGLVDRPLELGMSVASAAYSPDGERLFVTSPEGAVGLLRADTMKWIARATAAQPFPGWLIAFSADGSRVATAAEGRVGWWDGRTGAFRGAATIGDDAAVGFSPDGQRLAIAAHAGSVRNWDLRPGSWVEAACRMAGRDLTEAEWGAYVPGREFAGVCPS